MTQATTQASVTSQTIAVEHIGISSGRSFAEVRRKLEAIRDPKHEQHAELKEWIGYDSDPNTVDS